MIPRDEYLNFLLRFKSQQIINTPSPTAVRKIHIPGIVREYLLNNVVDKVTIHFITLKMWNTRNSRTIKLYIYVKSKMIPDNDELCFYRRGSALKNFEKAIVSLFINRTPTITITGSNYLMPANSPLLRPYR